jgi:hypothetical protein
MVTSISPGGSIGERAKVPESPASKSTRVSSRRSRLPRAWASRANFANGRTFCELANKSFLRAGKSCERKLARGTSRIRCPVLATVDCDLEKAARKEGSRVWNCERPSPAGGLTRTRKTGRFWQRIGTETKNWWRVGYLQNKLNQWTRNGLQSTTFFEFGTI